MLSKHQRRKEIYERATGKAYVEANLVEKGRLIKQVIRLVPHLLKTEYLKTHTSKLEIGALKDILAQKIGFWEVILPFHGILGAGGNLPSYLTQDNCNILPNGTGILILGSMFLELVETTPILLDFKTICFFNEFDASEIRYQKNYHFEDFSDMDNIEADEIFIIRK